MNNLTCKVCGAEFPPEKDKRYTVRDKQVTGGFATALSSSEPTLYDVFDCPECGCQVIAQERKRSAVLSILDLSLADCEKTTPPGSPEEVDTEGGD